MGKRWNHRKTRKRNQCRLCIYHLDNSFAQSKWSGLSWCLWSGLVWSDNLVSEYVEFHGSSDDSDGIFAYIHWRNLRCPRPNGKCHVFFYFFFGNPSLIVEIYDTSLWGPHINIFLGFWNKPFFFVREICFKRLVDWPFVLGSTSLISNLCWI